MCVLFIVNSKEDLWWRGQFLCILQDEFRPRDPILSGLLLP